MQAPATAPQSTSKSHTLTIDGMTGDVCVQSVTGALQSVPGVTTQSVKVGSAVISCDAAACTAACAAIGKAGFKAREASPGTDVKAADKSPKNAMDKTADTDTDDHTDSSTMSKNAIDETADDDTDESTDSSKTLKNGSKGSTNGQQSKGIASATIQPNKTFPAPAKSH